MHRRRIEEVAARRLDAKFSVLPDGGHTVTESSFFGSHPQLRDPSDVDDVQFLDTTLRDGEQAPGVSLTPEEKARIARGLDRAEIDFIEAGSACTGPGERETIKRVTDLDLDATITSFSRGIQNDIDLALDCDVDGVTIVVPGSDKHIETKVGTTHEENVQNTEELVAYAKDHDLWVEVIAEDGSRARVDYLEELMSASMDAGADRICYADTVGHATPDDTLERIEPMTELGPTSTHTHDDLGLAVTNALVSVAAGADLVHGTINGIGERAGNVALEEVAIALDHGYGVEPMDLTEVYDLAQLISRSTGVPLAPNKAVIGENAFTHESGIHTDGTLKDDAMYEPYPPEKVGRERRLVLGKHAGRAGVEAALGEHGIDADDDEIDEVVERVKAIGDRGKRVTDADLLTIAEEVVGQDRDRRVDLLEMTAASGSGTPTASVRVEVDGEERVASGTGSGPVDAAVSAVQGALGHAADASLDSYHVDAITGGTDAVVTVEVEMSRGDNAVTVAVSDADITRASVEAMVEAIDRLIENEPDQVLADD
ncbi:2-isopropylmalate synthase [Halorientalis pallida]|uniref:2-isopropylmalate synthase n=1 Tax=Halorientalis pallida TaxID=2479928 RepID=A0A498KVE4_9EURY|nr:2-isopropylmalate synthase [Halorientalis pallida]